MLPTGKHKGQNPSVASIYQALAEHARREAYPEAVDQAHADFAVLRNSEVCLLVAASWRLTPVSACGSCR